MSAVRDEQELALVGALLLHADVPVPEALSPDDFFTPSLREIFRWLADRGDRPRDLALLHAELGDEIASVAVEAMNACASPSALPELIALIRKASIQRRAARIGHDLAEKSLSVAEGSKQLALLADALAPTPERIPEPPIDELGLLGEYAAELALSLQVPEEFALAVALGALAVPCGLGVTVQVRNDWREPALLQMLVLAAPGERKSPLLRAAAQGLYIAERELRERRDEERREAGIEAAVLKDRVARARKGRDETALREALTAQQQHESPPPFRAVTRSGTGEALEKLAGEQTGRIAVVTDEGGALFGDLTRYSTTANYELLLAGYDASPYATERITRDPVVLDEARLPILALAQPIVLHALLADGAATGRGVVPRLALVAPGTYVGHRRGFAEPVSAEVAERWRDLLRSLMLQAFSPGKPALAVLAPAARARLEHCHDQIEPCLLTDLSAPLLREWAAKHVGRVARLAAILSTGFTGRLGGTIDVASMELAIALGDWLLAHAVRALGGKANATRSMTQRPRAELMAEALRDAAVKAGGELRREEAVAVLSDAGFGEVSERTVRRAVERGRKSGIIRMRKRERTGAWVITPSSECELDNGRVPYEVATGRLATSSRPEETRRSDNRSGPADIGHCEEGWPACEANSPGHTEVANWPLATSCPASDFADADEGHVSAEVPLAEDGEPTNIFGEPWPEPHPRPRRSLRLGAESIDDHGIPRAKWGA